jgi:hypothetical protein
MPFCPNCRVEYRSGIERCSDCDVNLVEILPEDAEVEPDSTEGEELVELAAFANAAEAEMIRELLEDNGIRTVLRGEVDPIGVVSGAAPSTLLVEQDDLEDARGIYEDFFAGESGENLEDEPEEKENDGEDNSQV